MIKMREKTKWISMAFIFSTVFSASVSAKEVTGVVTSIYTTDNEIAVSTTGGFCFSYTGGPEQRLSAIISGSSLSALVKAFKAGTEITFECRPIDSSGFGNPNHIIAW